MEPKLSMESARNIIIHWNAVPAELFIFDCDGSEITRFLQAVDRIQKSSRSREGNNPIGMAVSRLKHEFQNILTRQTDLHMNSSSMMQSSSITDSTAAYDFQDDYYMSCDGLSDEAIYNLRRIAEKMNTAGCLGQCVEVYTTVRKPFVDVRFKTLGVEKLSSGNIKSISWEDLKTKIDLWIRAAYVSVRILFKREKRVYEQIFDGLGTSTYNECFIETVKDAAIHLFNFAEALSSSPRSPTKLFKILDFYKALSDLSPAISALFPLESAKSIRIDAALILSQLEEVVRRILSDFESQVVHEQSPVPEAGGAIDRLTKYVMDYISLILNYKKLLTELIVSKPTTSFNDLVIPDMQFVQVEGRNPLDLHLILIIVVLQFKLEGKSRHYEDANIHPRASMVHLFMMNNVHYIVQHIKRSQELREMIGEDYLNKLSENVRQGITSYQRLTCDGMLYCLRDEGLHVSKCVSSGVSKSVLRERIKTFNARFEEVYGIQATWVVSDSQLREQLRLSILQRLIPDYKSFLDRFRSDIESRRHPHIIKFSVEELETLISRIFVS